MNVCSSGVLPVPVILCLHVLCYVGPMANKLMNDDDYDMLIRVHSVVRSVYLCSLCMYVCMYVVFVLER